MQYNKAMALVGNKTDWELQAMRKALSTFPILNSDDENKRLEAVKIIILSRKAKKVMTGFTL